MLTMLGSSFAVEASHGSHRRVLAVSGTSLNLETVPLAARLMRVCRLLLPLKRGDATAAHTRTPRPGLCGCSRHASCVACCKAPQVQVGVRESAYQSGLCKAPLNFATSDTVCVRAGHLPPTSQRTPLGRVWVSGVVGGFKYRRFSWRFFYNCTDAQVVGSLSPLVDRRAGGTVLPSPHAT